MAAVIFFRAVNVGGHQKFQPGALAKELAALGVVNIGAAGTWVVREEIAEAKLRAEVLRRLPFQPELMICPARDVSRLVAGEPFRDAPAGADIGHFASVLAKPPRAAPPLPLHFPTLGEWEIKIVHISGPFVLCARRPGKKDLYPNTVVEKHFGVAATTRNWNTFLKIREAPEK